MPDSFDFAFNELCHPLTSFANRILDDESEALSIAQDVLLKFWQQGVDLQSNVTRNKLYYAVRNDCISLLRKKQLEKETLRSYLQDFAAATEEQPFRPTWEDERFDFYSLLARLSPRERIVIEALLKGTSLREEAEKLGIQLATAFHLKHTGLKKLARLANDTSRVKLDEINGELIRHLARHPEKIYQIEPRKYEMLVAELLRDMGYDVHLTPPTADGGRDILAVIKVPPQKEILTLVECKRYSPDRKIGIDFLRSLLFTLRDTDKANMGWIATTSYFSEDARLLQKKYKWLLELCDFDKMKEWLNNYGKWQRSDKHGGLWLPTDPS